MSGETAEAAGPEGESPAGGEPPSEGESPSGVHPNRRRALLIGVGLGSAIGLGAAGAYAARGLPLTQRLHDETSADAMDAADRHGVTALLQARATAIRARDRSALLATLDPAADAGLRSRQTQLVGNLAQVPIAEWDYRLDAADTFRLPALPAEAVDASGGDVDRLAVRVLLQYRLLGYDTRPATSTQYLTLIRRGGARAPWRLFSDSDGAASGHATDVQLWDLGPVRSVRGRHSLVLGLRAVPALRALAEVADAAVPVVSRTWGTADGWPGRTVLLAPAGLDEFGALLGADPRAYESIAAVTTGELGSGTTAAAADRVIVNPQAYDGLTGLGRQVVITHETTHAATRALTEPWTPRWLAEGAADWTAYLSTQRTARQIAPELAADLTAGRVPDRLPTDADFASTAQRLAQSYEQAWLACRFVAGRYGAARLHALYRAVAASPHHEEGRALSSALDSVLGLSVEAFTAGWRSYLIRALRV